MQLFNLLAAATLAAATADFQVKMQFHYNATYDIKTGFYSPRQDSICLDSLPSYNTKRDWNSHEFSYPWPYVGGYGPIKESDSASCFNCYKIRYGEKSILFRAINSAKDGVDLGRLLFEELSGGKIGELKHINATLSIVDSQDCILREQLRNHRLPGILSEE
ncbi:hypothetical protein MKX08_009372 [Trichoderma sp. CBMAI-0020]|nr:hypothetical protein MKX08_009372 [Trichoderma sp. CBMAI-0020]